MANGVTIVPNGQTLIVTAGDDNVFYTDTGLSAEVAFPATVTSTTVWYCSAANANTHRTLTITQPDGTTVWNKSIFIGQTTDTFIRPLPNPEQLAADTGGARQLSVAPAGALAETYPRMAGTSGNQAALVSGRLQLSAVYLPAGLSVSSITYLSATTAAGTPTNQWFALYDSSRVLLGQTADDTSTAWAGSTAKTLSFATPVTTTYSGLHYVGICVAASTVPTLAGISPLSPVSGLVPIANGYADTGLTGTAPATATALTAFAAIPYAYLK